jgi:UDP-N-acetylmuramoylalanine--D-glutamate ligase
MRIEELLGKKVAIWGPGKEGWSTLKALRKRLPGQHLVILNDSALDAPTVALLSQIEDISVVIGDAVPAALDGFDVVIRSPGVSIYRKEIQRARENGVCFTTAVNLWFAENPQARTVCITGSIGKSTTTALTAHLLQSSGVRAVAAGNLGLPLLDLLEQPAMEVYVIELSSYQLCDFTGAPHVALLLNLYQDHLDWHQGEQNYYRDKLNIFRHQGAGGISLLNRTDRNTGSVFWDQGAARIAYFNDPQGFHEADDFICQGNDRLFPSAHVPLAGTHNVSNTCAALSMVQALGISPRECVSSLASFQGLPHRLQSLGERDGILYIDDSISKIPQSSLEAIKALSDKPITILVGGYDRGLQWQEFAQALSACGSLASVITMPDNGPRISAALREIAQRTGREIPVHEADSLAHAVGLARSVTPRGGIILLSPGSPSYGRFRDYIERGEAFARAAGFSAAANGDA